MDHKIIIRINKILSDRYFKMCEKESYTMSKRIRKIMELDIILNEKDINIIKELEKIYEKN